MRMIMKRLLAQIGITYFSVLAVAFYLPERGVWILFCTGVLVFMVLLLIRRTRKTVFIPAMALTVALGCGVNLGYGYLAVTPVQESCSGNDRRIEAVLTDEVYNAYSSYYYRLQTDRIDGEEASVKLLLKSFEKLPIEPFDQIAFTADLHRTTNNSYLAKGYYLSVNRIEGEYEITACRDRPLYAHVIRLRQALRIAMDEYLPTDVSSLCKAVLIGDKYALTEDVRTDFRYAGASFFIVVSGMHFSVICLLFYRLLIKLRVKRFIVVGLTLALIILYMSVTGFQGSVVRSGVMMLVYIVSCAIRRINDSFTSLGIAGIISALVFSPYGVGDIGLILSFAATFSILLWREPICGKLCFRRPDRWYKKCHNAVMQPISVSLAANLLVFPISVCVFRAFSPVTLLSSLLLYLPVGLILILSPLLCLFFYLGPLRCLSLVLAWPVYLLGRPALWLVDFLGDLPFAYLRIRHDFFYLWVGITAALVLIALALRRRYRLLSCAAVLSAVLLIGGTLRSSFVTLNTVELTALRCGEGMTVELNYHGHLYLLSLSPEYAQTENTLNALSSSEYSGAELAVCSTRYDLTNYSRLTDKEFAISRYLVYDSSEGQRNADIIPWSEDEAYSLGEGLTLYVERHRSMLLSYLTVDDLSVLVIPINFPLKAIPEEYRSADIIVISKPREEYTALTCDTLIISNTPEKAAEAAAYMETRCRELLCTGDETVTLPLR